MTKTTTIQWGPQVVGGVLEVEARFRVKIFGAERVHVDNGEYSLGGDGDRRGGMWKGFRH